MSTRIQLDGDVALPGGGRGVRFTNGDVELVASVTFGPRILRYARVGGDNAFGWVDPATQGVPTPAGGSWHLYGGHRLWAAPEDPERTYFPDNDAIRAEHVGPSLVLTQPVEPTTHLVKEMRLTLREAGTEVVVEHRITNAGSVPTELAVWSLTMMELGGAAIVPNSPFVPHPQGLLPVRRVVLWPYSNLGDPRFRFGERYLRFSQDRAARGPQKIGLYDTDMGWVAYTRGELLFLKRYTLPKAEEDGVDLGCNVEMFTDATMFELETLGPRVPLRRGETALHTERWSLHHASVPDDDTSAAKVLEAALAEVGPFPRETVPTMP